MSDRIHKKHTSRRDSNTTKTKDRDNARSELSRSEKFSHSDRRPCNSAYDERHRYRDTHSHHSDDARDIKRSKNSKDVPLEYNSKGANMGKSHVFGEGKNTITNVNAAEADKHDSEFNWEEHRSTLDAIFFQDEDMIKKGTVEYDEFWIFLQKYQAFSRKQLGKNDSSLHSAEYMFQPNRFNLPEKYDKHYRVNVSVLNKDVKGLLHRRKHNTPSLTEEKVASFRCILLHYVDFLQKQKFARLVKVKRDQQNLPIYEHRQEIVSAVARHQVVVVAGDTGCGKSTQVPQYLLSAGYTHIACTQPRRIACISLSRRVAYETLNEYGSEVAYQVCVCSLHYCEMTCFCFLN